MARQATLELLADASKLQKGLKDAGDDATRFGSHFDGIGKAIGGLVAGGTILKIGSDSVKAFTESAQAQSQLELALKNSKATIGVHAEAFADLNTKLARHTVADDDVIAATEARMVTFGASKKQIESMIPTVLDFAAKMGIDAPEAADLFDKASLGSVKALKTLGIEGYKPVGDKAKDLANIQALLHDKVKGAAQAQLDAAGPGVVLKKHLDELEETIGKNLVPALDKAAQAVSAVFDWVAKLIDVFRSGGLSAAVGMISDEFGTLWPKISAALTNTLSALGAWITGTAAPYLQQQVPVWVRALWEWIKDVTPPALRALGGLLADIGAWLLNTGLPTLGTALAELGKALWHWIQDSGPGVLEQLGTWMAQLGGWILTQGIPKLAGFLANLGVKLVDWIADVFPQLPGMLGEWMGKIGAWIVTTGIPKLVEFEIKLGEKLLGFIVDATQAAPGALAKFIGAIGGWLKDQGPGLLKDGVDIMTAAITAPFKFAFNTIAGFWNNTLGKINFSVPDWVPGLGGKGFQFPTITPLATGGIVTAPTLAMIGEAGPEAVVPLGRGGFGGVTIVVEGNILDGRDLADIVHSALLDKQDRGGPLGLTG